jgi:hypothetical protein
MGDLILGFREFTSICRVGISGKSWDSVLLFSSLLLLSVGHLVDSWLLQLEILTGWQDYRAGHGLLVSFPHGELGLMVVHLRRDCQCHYWRGRNLDDC